MENPNEATPKVENQSSQEAKTVQFMGREVDLSDPELGSKLAGLETQRVTDMQTREGHYLNGIQNKSAEIGGLKNQLESYQAKPVPDADYSNLDDSFLAEPVKFIEAREQKLQERHDQEIGELRNYIEKDKAKRQVDEYLEKFYTTYPDLNSELGRTVVDGVVNDPTLNSITNAEQLNETIASMARKKINNFTVSLKTSKAKSVEPASYYPGAQQAPSAVDEGYDPEYDPFNDVVGDKMKRFKG